MAEKTGRNGDSECRSNFGLKLNVHVQYNMLTAISNAADCLTCLRIEVNNLLK